MKRFSETDCDFFLEVIDTVANEGIYTPEDSGLSTKTRYNKFCELRAALRRDELLDLPWGYASVLASYVDYMDKVTITIKDGVFIATLKED